MSAFADEMDEMLLSSMAMVDQSDFRLKESPMTEQNKLDLMNLKLQEQTMMQMLSVDEGASIKAIMRNKLNIDPMNLNKVVKHIKECLQQADVAGMIKSQ